MPSVFPVVSFALTQFSFQGTYNFFNEDPVRFLFHILMPCLALVVMLASPTHAARQSRPPQAPQHTGDLSPTDESEARTRLMRDMEKKAAKERVAALKNDTDKLLKLSVELKAYVDKSDENVLSLEVIKKADEIEKLAKSVKDKMKGPN